MVRLLAVGLAFSSALLFSTTVLSKPADIAAIEQLSAVYDIGLVQPSSSWMEKAVEAGTNHRVARAVAIAKAGGFEELLTVDRSSFEEALREPLRLLAMQARKTNGSVDRAKKLHEMLVVTTEDRGIHDALAEFLGFPSPGGLVSAKFEPAKLSFAKYASAYSETDRLAVVKSETRLVSERGGSGAGNGIPDAGEWIQISMAIKNVSRLPYFSSSAWVKTSSACAWAPSSREFEFPELPAGGDSTGELEVWVYLSRTCPDGESISLQVSVRDTHRTRGGAHLLTVKIPVRNRLQHKTIKVKLDRDVPGYSDGTEADITDGDQSFEFSHGLRYNPKRFEKALMGWGLGRGAKTLITEHAFREDAPMLVEVGETGRLLPGDDYDITTIGRESFKERVRQLGRTHGWVNSTDAHVVFASDVVLAYEDPQPPPYPNKIRPARERNCTDGRDEDGDGATDCDDSDCADYSACQQPNPPSVEKVMSLVKATTRIEAQRTGVVGDDGIDAVNDHYELAFDQMTFARNYQCLVDGTPLASCGVEACPSCTKAPRTAEPAPTPPKRYVTYVHRSYFRVPVKWTPEPGPCDGVTCSTPRSKRCDGTWSVTYSSLGKCAAGNCSYPQTKIDCAASGKICRNGECVDKPRKPPPPVAKPLEDREHRLSLGYYAAAIIAPLVEIEDRDLWETKDASTSDFSLRYSRGRGGLTYFGGLAFGSGEIDSRGDDTKLSTFRLSLGAGYLWTNASRRIELHPRAGLLFVYRGLNIDEQPWTEEGTLGAANMDVSGMGVGLELGSSVRGRISNGLAAYLDFSYVMQGAGPAWAALGGDEILLLSGSHTVFGGGVTFLFD